MQRYTIEVENGVTGVDLTQFAALVQTTLVRPAQLVRRTGVALQRVDSGPVDFHVTLTSSMTVRQLCGYDLQIETSCYAAPGTVAGHAVNRVVLNDARWVRGDVAYVGRPGRLPDLHDQPRGRPRAGPHARARLPGRRPGAGDDAADDRAEVRGHRADVRGEPVALPAGRRPTPRAPSRPTPPQNSEFDPDDDGEPHTGWARFGLPAAARDTGGNAGAGPSR